MAEEVKSVSKAIADTIKKAAALNHKVRLKIVLAVFNTEVLKIGNSLTLSQLEKILNIDKHDLAYHILVLKEAGVLSKKEYIEDGKKRTYYQTTSDCVDVLNILGINKGKIKNLTAELSIAL